MEIYENLPEQIHILKVPVTFFDSHQHAIACIANRIEHNIKTFCVAINPEKIYCAGKDHALLDILQNAHIGICDGVGVSIAAKILHGRYIPRCTGVDIFIELVRKDLAHEEVDQATKILLNSSPNQKIGVLLRILMEDVLKKNQRYELVLQVASHYGLSNDRLLHEQAIELFRLLVEQGYGYQKCLDTINNIRGCNTLASPFYINLLNTLVDQGYALDEIYKMVEKNRFNAGKKALKEKIEKIRKNM